MTTFIGLAKEKMVIEGFTCKPGFGIFYDTEGKIAFSSGWKSGGLIMIYHRTGTTYERRWEYAKGQNAFLTQQAKFYSQLEFDTACEEAGKIPECRLAPSVYIKCTDVVPGRRCNNGGEYGFYTHYSPTDVPGVFWKWTSTTCDFDRCGTTGYDGGRYVVLTKKRMRRLMQISDRIEEEGDLYNPS